MTVLKGKVKWFDKKKGFGFIIGPDQRDVFVHFSVIRCDGFKFVDDDQEVWYEFTEGKTGLLALNVYKSDPTTLQLDHT